LVQSGSAVMLGHGGIEQIYSMTSVVRESSEWSSNRRIVQPV